MDVTKTSRWLPWLAALCLGAPALAQVAPAQAVSLPPLAETTPTQLKEGEDPQLRFIAFFLSRVELTDVAPQNDLLQGQTVGRLFGPNSTRTWSQASFFAEQRLIPFFIYEPKILDGMARLRAGFEIKFTWGDANYGVGGNFGGAINAKQVNLQTSNLEIEFNLPFEGWYMDVGLQRLYDNPRDLYRTFFSTLALTGDRLAYWGTDAVGVSVYGQGLGNTYKLGAYQLYENKIKDDDDVSLFEGLVDRHLGDTWHVGGNVRYLRDRSNGLGGVSVLSQGPDSKLAEYNGAFRFPLQSARYRADILWAGLDGSFNPEFSAGRWGGSAFVVANFGQVRTLQPSGQFTPAANILGVAADARVGYRYGITRNEVVQAEALVTTGDANGIADGWYNGVITGNTWGAPGAPYTSHGAYLLMPHLNVVNRLTAAVSDISNMGFGLTFGTLSVSKDLIPNVLTAKLGTAVGVSNVAPANGGAFIGVEANASLAYQLAVFFSVEVHAAYLHLGDFYDDPVVAGGERPLDPWTTFVTLKWLIF